MSFSDVAQSRHLAARAATLTFQGTDQDGEPTDPGTVTVAVTDSTGTAVTAGAVTAAGTVRSSVIANAYTGSVDRLTAVWSSSGVDLATTSHDIVGGVFCTVAEIRADSSLNDTNLHPSAALITDRSEAEYQIESACNRAFVPRFWSETISGNGRCDIVLAKPDLREVVWANRWDGTAWVAVTPDVTLVPPDGGGIAVLLDGYTWPAGRNNIQIGYRYGWNSPPADLRRAAAKAVQHHRHGDQSGIPDRAISIQGSELGNVVLATAGIGGWITAVPGIDEVLKRYKFKRFYSA